MTRNKKLMLNSTFSLFYQLTTLICGFVLPRIFLQYFGSEVNGLVASVSQFLGFISLAECGVGAVVQSTLYKPLAEKDDIEISKIIISSERFFRRIAYILVVYTVGLMIIYPFIALDSFDYFYTLLLILVISISTFAQYYFGMTYRLLLTADQLGFVQYLIHSVALIVNTVACILLMLGGASIHFVKLTTSLIFLAQPLLLAYIAKRRYHIDRAVVITEEPIKQKWNGLAQHIAAVVLGNTPTVVLTLFSTLKNVSVYTVYYMVVNGVKQILMSLTNGIQSMLGNMLAKNEKETLLNTFDNTEWVLHTVTVFVFACTAGLILPFVTVYTDGITDTNYILPLFAYLITFAHAAHCFRLPYNIMILAAGHYKQTQASAIIEVVINIVLSVSLVFSLGIVGVAIGTLVAMLYRTCYFAWYLSKNIINRSLQHFIKHIFVDVLCFAGILLTVNFVPNFFELSSVGYFSWFVLAIKVAIVAFVICLILNIVFYRDKVNSYSRVILSIFKRRLKKSN